MVHEIIQVHSTKVFFIAYFTMYQHPENRDRNIKSIESHHKTHKKRNWKTQEAHIRYIEAQSIYIYLQHMLFIFGTFQLTKKLMCSLYITDFFNFLSKAKTTKLEKCGLGELQRKSLLACGDCKCIISDMPKETCSAIHYTNCLFLVTTFKIM